MKKSSDEVVAMRLLAIPKEDILEDLEWANKKRNRRILQYYEVIQMIEAVMKKGDGALGVITGGNVSKNYEYSTLTTIAAAYRKEDEIFLQIGTTDARDTFPEFLITKDDIHGVSISAIVLPESIKIPCYLEENHEG